MQIQSRQNNNPVVAVIGGGPAGLMAADVLSQAGVKVNLYDSMPSVGRKSLMAGKSGLNLTHAEEWTIFLSRYAKQESKLTPILNSFTSSHLRDWARELGVDTFVGSSGKVFPVNMKAAPLLRAWLHRLRGQSVRFHVRHRWIGWDAQENLVFHYPEGKTVVHADAVIFALGGGSWARLGSTGDWVHEFQKKGISVHPLKPANCGFEVPFSSLFFERFSGQPIKSIRAKFIDSHGSTFDEMGELVMTETGIEGSLIYQLSALLREEISRKGSAIMYLDLMPHQTFEQLLAKLTQPRAKRSFSTHLKKQLSIDGVKAGLLRETLSKDEMNDLAIICRTLKALPLKTIAPRPIDEAISTAGGMDFEALNDALMLRQAEGVFCAGEMLDWEAPTGGYLLTACFATGRWAGLGALAWLKNKEKK
ncbi:MAG: TIGR03862 family flavoprotein [Methylococcales bacterium]|nr:TIGR03862 family flavoprotein [Methylococcales bacterium]